MPVRVRAKYLKEGGKAFKIVEINTGRVVGESDTKAKAEGSARVRNAARRRKAGG